MAPAKSTRPILAKSITAIPNMSTSGILKNAPGNKKINSKRNNIQDQNIQETIQTRGKRKAETSPVKNEQKFKRTALSNLTNNNVKNSTEKQINNNKINNAQNKGRELSHIQNIQTQALKDASMRQGSYKIMTRAAAAKIEAPAQKSNIVTDSVFGTAPPVPKLRKNEVAAPLAPVAAHVVAAIKVANKATRRISNEFNKTEESLYMSALEDVSSSCETTRLSGSFEVTKQHSVIINKEVIEKSALPPGVEDFDLQNWNDPFQVSNYAMDIFNYLKSREVKFYIDDYMPRQVNLSKWMRSLLVDWMVEVQETFELNHETLYLAVKIVDLYLCRIVIHKDKLQLLGAAALFIACKFDERTPPLVDDFLYICDGAYKTDELIKTEMHVLRTINFDLGVPLSYRFLRRYARCGRVSLPSLTLARFILELSLMDYDTVSLSDSRLASAALFMALRLHGSKRPWTITFEYYSGYKLTDFAHIVPILNVGLHRKPKGTIKTIYSKYSHKIFHEVAHVPLMSTQKLFEHNITEEECAKLNIVIQPLPLPSNEH